MPAERPVLVTTGPSGLVIGPACIVGPGLQVISNYRGLWPLGLLYCSCRAVVAAGLLSRADLFIILLLQGGFAPRDPPCLQQAG